jgi:hypothetical protein
MGVHLFELCFSFLTFYTFSETNLKLRQAQNVTAELTDENSLSTLQGTTVEVEPPNNMISTFHGVLKMPGKHYPT